MKRKMMALLLAVSMMLGTGFTADAEEGAEPAVHEPQHEMHGVNIETSVKTGDYIPLGTDPLGLVTSVMCKEGCELKGKVEHIDGDLNELGTKNLEFYYSGMDNNIDHVGSCNMIIHVEDPSNPTPRPLKGVSLDRTEITVQQNEEFPLLLSTQPAENVIIQENVGWNWSDSDSGILKRFGPGEEGGDPGRFGEKARFKALNAGTTTITADLQGFTATCKVTVNASVPAEVPLKGISLNQSTASLKEGESLALQVSYNPENTTDPKGTEWSSSNAGVATVTDGKVTARSSGTAVITAKVGKHTATCKVTVNASVPTDTSTISYQTHVQTYGWQDWVSNGAMSGTSGEAKRLEGIKIKLDNQNIKGNVEYRTHVQTYGWQGMVQDGAMSGTSGEAKRLEGIEIELLNKQYDGDIRYKTHVQTYGWQDWVSNGAMSGTLGQAKRLEAMQIELTGKMAENYDVYYRVHAQTFGWLGWAKNGEPSGSAGYAKRLEGTEIRLVPKGGAAPGSTENPYMQK